MAQTLSELSRCKVPLSKGDTPFVSWDSELTLVTEKNVSILKLSHNIHCLDKKIDWVRTDIACPKTSPAACLFSKKLMKQSKINNLEYTQMMLDPALWPHNVQLMEEMASVVSIQWSPPNFVYNHESVVAILNNIGNIELFSPTSCGYSSLLNVSSVITSCYKDQLKDRRPDSIEEVKILADALETCAFCWGAQYKNTFHFVTAQKNGNIHFWRLLNNREGIDIKELAMQPAGAGEIVTMQWIPISNDVFLLVLTNMLGQLYVYKYHWENECPKLINCDSTWPHKDRMIIRYLKYTRIDDKIILICNKHRHLLVLLIDDCCNKISEYLKNLNDYKITVISESKNKFYIGTINCKIYKVNIMIKDCKLNVCIEEKIFKENLVNHDLCGLGFSKNQVFCALAVVNRKILFRKETYSVDIIFLCDEESHETEIELLLNNPTQKLTDYWDCIELIRCKSMKLKILPFIDYNQLYTNEGNVYRTKIYLILLTYYHSLNNIIKNKSKGWLPVTSIEAVKEQIILSQAKKKITDLCQKTKSWTDLESEMLTGAKKYVKYYCEKYKKDLAEYVPSSTLCTMKDDEYTCQYCPEDLRGFSCPNGHINMICGITLTLIESDEYLSCSACGLVARKELLPENPTCLFCDLHLNSYFFPS